MLAFRALSDAIRCTTRQLTFGYRHLSKAQLALKESELNLPAKPKKPRTPWLLFVAENKDGILKERNMTAAEMAKILSKEWSQVDRTKYEEEYSRLRAEYERQTKEYEESLNDEHRQLLALQKESVRDSRLARDLRKTKPPRLPRSAPNLYVAEKCQEEQVKKEFAANKSSVVLTRLLKEYKELDEESKVKYEDLKQRDKLRFQHEFIQWYEGIHSDKNTTNRIRAKADQMFTRFKSLSYI